MKRLSSILIAALTALSATVAQTPADSLARFVKDINAFNQLYPQEKVYLHFDNTGYFMGETIWFKAYVMNSTTMEASDMSRVLHVELLTPEGRILTSQKLKIEKGQAHGSLPLTEVLHAGFYEVRAYTRMMLNWDKELMFSRVFPIFDAPQEEGIEMYDTPTITRFPHTQRSPYKRDKQPDTDKLNLTFFPEGGHLTEGLTSAIYFKATDKQGQAAQVEGIITNSHGKKIAPLKSIHQGMGKTLLTPLMGETYKAEVEWNGHNYTFDLPATRPTGYSLSMEEQDSHLTVKLARRGNETREVGLSVMERGSIVQFGQVRWDEQEKATVDIPKERLQGGVLQITLFDTEGHIHAERLAFIRPQKGILMSYKANKEYYAPCEIVEMDFLVSDRDNRPVETNFSLSVRDADYDTPHNRTASQAEANLLLGSDLKGFIHDIDYYFEADDQKHRAALDLLMGTHGYRRYDWAQMTRPKEFNPKHFIEEGIVVKGELRSVFRNRVKDNVEINVNIWSSSGQVKRGKAMTDSLGRFAFQAEDFTGKWNMYITTKEDGKRKEMTVKQEKDFAPQGRALYPIESLLFKETENRNALVRPIIELSPDTLQAEEFAQHWDNLLPTVEVEAKQRWKQRAFRRWQNIIYDMEEELLRMDDTGEEYLMYVTDWLHEWNRYFDKYSNTYKGKDIIYEFVPRRREINLNVLSIDEVEAVTISDKPHCIMRAMAENPDRHLLSTENFDHVVITIFVKDKYFNRMGKDRKGERHTKLQGYSPERQFYMPDYSESLLPDEKDYRRTLYWNPNVETDSNGEATISFYNSPTCKQMKVSAATVTADGLMGNLEE